MAYGAICGSLRAAAPPGRRSGAPAPSVRLLDQLRPVPVPRHNARCKHTQHAAARRRLADAHRLAAVDLPRARAAIKFKALRLDELPAPSAG
eukprot:2299507-Prymnesium_polylepis.1